MTVLAKPTAIEQAKSGGITHVDNSTLRQLADWVENIASPEELAWNSDRFKEVRDWLKMHKSAKALRIAAVRVECISLRKVALAGFTHKLRSANERKAAEHFAGLTDEEFAQLLRESESTTSPWTVARAQQEDQAKADEWTRARASDHTGRDHSNWSDDISNYQNLHSLTEEVLNEITSDSDSFTVAEAAEKLYAQLTNDKFYRQEDEDGEPYVPPEISGEPLREVVRRVLRVPGPADRAEIKGVEVKIPRCVTFDPPEWGAMRRVPWDRATIGQLEGMVAAREKQAREMVAAAESLRVLYEALEACSQDSSDRVNELTEKAGIRRKEEV